MSKATELADKLEEDPSMWGGLSKVAWPAAGELRRLDAENDAMRQRVAELEAQLAHGIGCFEAAEAEGLSQALAETADERLKDLVERRLMYATQAMPQPEQPEVQGDHYCLDVLVSKLATVRSIAASRLPSVDLATIDDAITVLRTRQQPEPAVQGEPVAFKVYKGEVCYKSKDDDQSYGMWCPLSFDTQHGFPDGTCFYTHPQPVAQPEQQKLKANHGSN